MKNKGKRFLALLLACALMAGPAAGCQSGETSFRRMPLPPVPGKAPVPLRWRMRIPMVLCQKESL